MLVKQASNGCGAEVIPAASFMSIVLQPAWNLGFLGFSRSDQQSCPQKMWMRLRADLAAPAVVRKRLVTAALRGPGSRSKVRCLPCHPHRLRRWRLFFRSTRSSCPHWWPSRAETQVARGGAPGGDEGRVAGSCGAHRPESRANWRFGGLVQRAVHKVIPRAGA